MNFFRKIFNKPVVDNKPTARDLFTEDKEYYNYKKGIIRNSNNTNMNFDKSKDSLLLIDDNEGMVSFLIDDIDYLNKMGIVDKDSINIITVTGSHAGFDFEVLHEKYKGLNIKWAIIDITLEGSVMTPKGNIKYTGVDVFEMIYKINKDLKFIFYTGNNLNPYIKSNKKIIDRFKDITNENIVKYILFKTSFDMKGRRDYIIKKLFSRRKNEI